MNATDTMTESAPAEAILAELIARGGDIGADEGRLRLRGVAATALSPDLRDAIRAHREAILDELGDRRAVPLSSIQNRLWFLQQLDAGGTGYTFSYTHRLSGPVDTAKLDQALNAVLAAHPGLRAGFEELGGTPVQFLAATAQTTTTVLERVATTPQDAERQLRDELVRPFDLARPPLLRSALVRLVDGDWLWGLTLHHLIADGWTYALILRQLSEAYAGRSPQPDSAADYPAFVAFDLAARDDPRRTAALDHWDRHLSNVTDGDLPLDRPRPQLRTYRGGTADLRLAPGTARALRSLAEQEGTTLFAALLAVHAAVLSKHTGSDNPVIGTPYANRPGTRFHATAGCFVSTLVLPVDLTEQPTFRELVARTGQTCATAWDHADYAYERLVERLSPQRDTSRNALFQSFFALQDIPARLTLPRVTSTPVPFDTGTTQFDLEVYLTPADDGALELTLRYNKDLFDETTAEAFAHRWRHLAEQLVESPDRAPQRFPALTGRDRAAVTAANRSDRPYESDKTAEELFRAQAARTPDQPAVLSGGQELTYGQLDARVDVLAGQLRAHGCSGERVGILMPRSAAMVAAVLATMRADATFVPLAPDLPAERLSQMIANCVLKAVWTGPDTTEVLPAGVLGLDATSDTLTRAPSAAPRPEARPAAAYVLHTSGSTGVPKGVEVPHSALVNLLTTMGDQPGLNASDVLVSVTGLFFDISLLELLLPLITGARVVVATDDETRDPALLAATLDRHQATVMQATPSCWRMLLDAGWTGRPQLRAWSGGEPLSRNLADRLLDRTAEVWNLYGPTETTIWSALWRVQRGNGPVLIGEPVANTTLHVLDRHRMPVPPGVPGELHIAGDGLALGYLNQLTLTQERFALITTEHGRTVRAYRTGDLARRLNDGSLAILGRTDEQLKVRGHRVEPEEIEHALRSHPSVREAVVVLTGDGTLVGHLLTEPSTDPADAELTTHLGRLLRPALIPQRFMRHAQLPQTANGKTDRGALRRQPLPDAGPASQAQPPRTSGERLVASVFQEVLGVAEVGADDDFFRLGGHSLAATSVLYRLEQATGTRVPLHVFMQDAAVGAVARQLAPQDSHDQDNELQAALDLLESMPEEEAASLLAPPSPRS